MNHADSLANDHLAIFLFHGVVDRGEYVVRNYTRKHVAADAFDLFLSTLCRSGQPVSMNDVIEIKRRNAPYPTRSFAITFDDGFENNLSVAAPLLRKYKVPATFYVTTGFIGTNRMSWIDRIEWAFEEAGALAIRVPWSKTSHEAADAAAKMRLLDEIRKHVKSKPGLDPDAFASDVQTQLGFDETHCSDGPLDLKLTWDQVRALDGDPLFTIGGHSHTHAILSFLDTVALDRELDTSLGLLESKAGIVTRHYSYPEGLAHCYSEAVIEALRRRGIACCPTAEPGTNDSNIDLFHLKRIAVT
jgi:peptidoglycan/xylan/chitin deacetylase (PgdA/CDA1 family)